MDRSRQLILAGAGLIALALLLGLGLLLARPGAGPVPEPLPEEVSSAPLAPSQPPDPSAAQRGKAEADADVVPDARDGDGEASGGSVPLPEPRERTSAPAPSFPSGDEAIVFCLPSVIPTPDGCAARETVLGFAGEPIGEVAPDGTMRALTVELASPDPAEPPTTVETCDDLLTLREEGWGALTQAGMAREQRMDRFCDLIVMARRAEPARGGGLERLDYGVLAQVPPKDWPSFGESSLEDPVVSLSADEPRTWLVAGQANDLVLQDVATADFNEDGRSEVLVYAALAARGGTARWGGYLLARRAGNTTRLSPIERPLRPAP